MRDFATLFSCLFLAWFTTSAWAGDETISLQTIPPLDQARPLSEPVKILLRVSDSDGKPVAATRVKIRLYAPRPGRLFSTDFPHIEGTLLLDMELPSVNGSITWEYAFPIRGDYRLEVEPTDQQKEDMKKVFNLKVKENRYRLFSLGSLIVVLFLLGFTGGRLFTGARETPGLMTFTLLLLVFSLGLSPSGEIQTREREGSESLVRLNASPAVVGKISRIQSDLVDAETGNPVPSRFSLSISHLEKGRKIFSVENIPTEGNFTLGFHFTDASDHLLNFVAEPESKRPAQEKMVIPVAGLDPPREAFLPPMILLLAVLVLGLAAGRISRQFSFTL